VEKMQNESGSVNPGFRLWLTSMPSGNFPVPVLQNGIKVTNEPPRGLRSNLIRTYQDVSEEEYESCTKPEVYKKMLFATAFFNALILERRKFGAVGWNIPYDWMNSDLKAAMTQVRMYVEEQTLVPWETLNVSVSDITYGGRVTDVWDKRSISSILRKYFDPQLLDQGYTFTENGLYYAPPVGSIADTVAYVRQLPVEDRPEVFGLHSNAAINFQQKESRALLATVVMCSGGGGGGGGGSSAESNDTKVKEQAMKMGERMPAPYDLRKAHPESFKVVGESMISLGVFLSQELDRFNDLIGVMVVSLKSLVRAIKGEVVMSAELEVMYNCFVFQTVPPAWTLAGYPCLKPLPSWTEDFFARIEFMARWLHDGPRPSYWLPGFFFPQGFMTAVKQTYSREFKIAVDTLRIGCELTNLDYSDIDGAPPTGAYVYGLFMEGGRFDRTVMAMAESLPRQLLSPMPCIWLKPVISASYDPSFVYNCPLYKTSIRAGTLSTTGHSTNFVVALPVPTAEEGGGPGPDHWIRRGCAMLCMEDE
jgi:dynein heavy chain